MQLYTLVHSSWETNFEDQDKSFLQLGGSTQQFQMDCLIPLIDNELVMVLQVTHDLDLLYNS